MICEDPLLLPFDPIPSSILLEVSHWGLPLCVLAPLKEDSILLPNKMDLAYNVAYTLLASHVYACPTITVPAQIYITIKS